MPLEKRSRAGGGVLAAAVCWLGTGDDGGEGSDELYDRDISQLLHPNACCYVTGLVPARSAAPGLTTDSTLHHQVLFF